MSHDHSHQHNHHHHHSHEGTGNIRAAFFLNLAFTVFELAGGFFTNSMAVISDAIHDLGDCLSLGMAWYFQKKTGKASNESYTYGYKRFSLLGAIINSIVLVVGSVFILSEAIPRLFHPEPAKTEGIFILAIVGILVNGAAMFRLKKGDSINERVVGLHFLEDVLSWVAILLGAVVMHFFNLPVIDPILSIAIAGFILFNVYKNIRETLHIILQGTPAETDMTEISKLLKQNPAIDDIHDLHIWSVDGSYNVLTVHVVLRSLVDIGKQAALKTEIRETLTQKGIQHATIEFETSDEKCNFEKCC